MTTRREFVHRSALVAAGLPLIRLTNEHRPLTAGALPPWSFLDVQRQPDSVLAQMATGERSLRAASATTWEDTGVRVTIQAAGAATQVRLTAPGHAVKRLRLRWRGHMDATRL